jgi:hypothetical protein
MRKPEGKLNRWLRLPVSGQARMRNQQRESSLDFHTFIQTIKPRAAFYNLKIFPSPSKVLSPVLLGTMARSPPAKLK